MMIVQLMACCVRRASPGCQLMDSMQACCRAVIACLL